MAHKEPTFTDIPVDKKPGRTARHKRRRLTRLFKEQGGLCLYCKEPMWLLWKEDNIFERNENRGIPRKLATLEHKIPKMSFLGSDKPKNLACSCYDCNQDKDYFNHFTYKIMLCSPKIYNIIRYLDREKKRIKYISKLKGKTLYEKIRYYFKM